MAYAQIVWKCRRSLRSMFWTIVLGWIPIGAGWIYVIRQILIRRYKVTPDRIIVETGIWKKTARAELWLLA